MRQNLGESHETATSTLTTALHTADKKTTIAHFILESTTFSTPIFFRKISMLNDNVCRSFTPNSTKIKQQM
jgi:hypothetical protein